MLINCVQTTATTLAGATYFLLTHPDVLTKLKQEVRSKFSSTDEITIASVGKLTYMLAVLNEALRLYPPVTAGLVRKTPPEGATIAGHYVAGNVGTMHSTCLPDPRASPPPPPPLFFSPS